MKHIQKIFVIALLAAATEVSAQEVGTLYFLENAPMRHIVNPAFQPVSNGYVNFTPLGYMSMHIGNNSLTMSDLLYLDPTTGKTITPLHPNGDRQALIKSFRKSTLIDGELTCNLLGFGFRYKEKGYININIMQRIDMGVSTPKSLYSFLLNGGMAGITDNMTQTYNLDLTPLGTANSIYTEIAGGYSHRINDHWTVGGKVKFLLGQVYAGFRNQSLNLDASLEEWHLYGTNKIAIAGPMNFDQLPERLNTESLSQVETSGIFYPIETPNDILNYLKPSGYGAAFDLGFTYKPIEQVQITAAVNDLGFIYWNNGRQYTTSIDSSFVGAGEFEYNHYVVDGQFSVDSLLSDVTTNLSRFANVLHSDKVSSGFARMTNMRLNVGVDANFWDNRVGVGILSSTRLYNNRLYEEVTLGAAFRPVHWFNLAVSYSLIQNGKFSNIGAGLSFMPYDGINLTLAMDYIPTSYAGIETSENDQKSYVIPYKTKGVNLALGFSIVWGTNNKKDSDKDGIIDKLDMCPNTPRNIQVDELGCPLDSDGDGIPDYMDTCPETPHQAYGMTDTTGCPIDSDGDGVPDYLDQCPNTPAEARSQVDEKGCALDNDGDGVPDYLDRCPDTPAEARTHVDENGCELDTDGDGVPDYLDLCPNTPTEARGFVDANGCELDTDSDGVPDWKDKCNNTPQEARGFVDANGCELDTDGDYVPDWKDECPTSVGPAYNKGCPEVKREVRNLLKKAMQGIQFETGKAVIKSVSFPLMDQIASIFVENTNYIIEVQGHTDNVGNANYNKELSDKRAHAVRDYLIKKGVPAERLTAKGYGMEKPIADNKTKAGRAQNRRVEFDITFEEITHEIVYDHADSTLLNEYLKTVEPQPVAESNKPDNQ